MNISDFTKVNPRAKVRTGRQPRKPGSTSTPIIQQGTPVWCHRNLPDPVKVDEREAIEEVLLKAQGFIA